MEEVYCGVLCPLRIKGGQRLETLLTRRNFVKPTGEMMIYPGEWVSPGGTMEPVDGGSSMNAAVREFKEELCYPNNGPMQDPFLLREAEEEDHGVLYKLSFFGVYGIDSKLLNFPEDLSGEVINYAWLTPHGSLNMIRSKWFVDQQLREFKERSLPLVERQFPKQQYLNLQYLLEHEDVLTVPEEERIIVP